MKQTYTCFVCKNLFTRYPSQITNNSCCSRQCNSVKLRTSMIGSNNPNFGRNWSSSKKNLQSKIVKIAMQNDDVLYKVGSANRGKKFNDGLIKKMHGGRSPQSYSHPHSEETKKLIGYKSSEKFSQSYKDDHRKKMEESGLWIPLSKKSDWEIYKKISNWSGTLIEYLTESDWVSLNGMGFFHAKNNSKGLVRDHILSRKTGFNLGIFPELMRHPSNLQLISHSDNVKKAHSHQNEILYNELFDRVINYTRDWKEQDRCIFLINQYYEGNRWSRSLIVTT